MRGVPRLLRGQLARGVRRDVRPELGGVDRDDPGEISDVVELEVLVHAESFAERAREHSAAGGGSDDRELLEGQADGACRHSFTQNDVDPEIFHDRVDEFLDGAGQAMDLVDEEDRALGRVGQERHDVHLLVERRTACDVELDAELVVQARSRTSSCPGRGVRRRGYAGSGSPRFRAAARLISSRSATARWPITSESRCGRSFSSTGSATRRSAGFESGSSSLGPPWIVVLRIVRSSSVSRVRAVEMTSRRIRPEVKLGERFLSTLLIDRFYHIGD